MKLITLNAWGAQIRQPFLDFIEAKRSDIDIFCFQEIYDRAKEKLSSHYPNVSHDIFSELVVMLPDHTGFFRPVLEGAYGIATFVRKDIDILEEGEIIIHKNVKYSEMTGHHTRNLQWLKVSLGGRGATIINVHGLWNGAGKTDTPDRIAQSERIRDFIRTLSGPKILCGDFNLRPDTESLKIASEGMRNLVAEFGVRSTARVCTESRKSLRIMYLSHRKLPLIILLFCPTRYPIILRYSWIFIANSPD